MKLKHNALLFVFVLSMFAFAQNAKATDCAVTTGADDGEGSLRACVASTEDGDTITIPSGTTVALTSGAIDILKNISIVGGGRDTTTIDGSGNNARIFTVGLGDDDLEDVAVVTISGLTLTGGSSDNGGAINIKFGSVVNISDSAVTNNSATANGGAINLYISSLFSSNTLFNNNTAVSSGGAICGTYAVIQLTQGSEVNDNSTDGDPGYGGAIYAEYSSLTVSDSTISNNTVMPSGYGGAIYNLHSGANILNSEVNGNTVGEGTGEAHGGAIFNELTLLTIDHSKVNNNTVLGLESTGHGGAIFSYLSETYVINGSEMSGNTASDNGGAYYGSEEDDAEPASLIVENSTLDGNTATNGYGGAIFDYHSLSVKNSTISNNRVLNESDDEDLRSGGGIYVYSYTGTLIENTVIHGNSVVGYGGGVYSDTYSANYNNVTITNNEATVDGGGLYNNYSGMHLSNVTIANNTADSDEDGTGDGGGFFNDGDTLSMVNSIVANNTDTGGENADCSNDSTLYSLISVGGNLIGEVSDGCQILGSSSTYITGDPGLDPNGLADNGGETQTIALSADSIALDAGVDEYCLATDQRGTSRPQGTHCDIGAFEAGPEADLSGTTLSDGQLVFASQFVGQTSDTQTLTLSNVGTYDLLITSISIVGDDALEFVETHDCADSLAPGTSCTINVHGAPTQPGLKQATLTFDTNAGLLEVKLYDTVSESAGCGLITTNTPTQQTPLMSFAIFGMLLFSLMNLRRLHQ